MFFNWLSLHLNDLDIKLRGFVKTIDIMFERKSFEIKLENI
jgi:hypothetical protein